jgi:WXG100 family type VII secretion target
MRMSVTRIRADFTGLSQVAQSFGREADNTSRMTQNLKSKMETLQGGHWKGDAANKFYAEMTGAVFPALTRLTKALTEAQQITQKIDKLMHQTEQTTSRIFVIAIAGAAGGAAVGASTGAGAATGGAGGTAGAGGATSGGSTGGSTSGGSSGGGSGGGTPDFKKQNPLLVRDPKGEFTDQYFTELTNAKIQGADSKALHDALSEFQKDPAHASDALLQRIADARGKSLGDIKADYQKFLDLKAQRDAAGGDPIANVNEFLHPDFNGSLSQMRYGKVVGDAFGVDPVFGSMLNPAGGLVGPDNASFDGDSTAVGFHGVVHDAAGYLYNYHNKVGPGYDYMGLEGRDTSSPLSGQRAGIQYWRDRMGDDWKSAGSQSVMENVVVPAADAFNSASSWVSDKFQKLKSVF